MKRIIGIILIIAGIALAIVAFNRHEEDRTILDLGKVEIKQDSGPSESTALYYVLAAVCVIGGGVLVGKKV